MNRMRLLKGPFSYRLIRGTFRPAQPLRERLAFKSGTAIKRCYFGEYRFSEDLDFTQLPDVPFEAIRTELDAVFEDVHRSWGIVMRYEREDCQTHANSHTFYLAYEGPLPARSAKEVKVDITIRERLVLPLAERAVVRGYEEYEDLPDDALVRVYPLDEIVVEKIAPSATAHETSPVIYTMSGTSRVKVTLTSAA